jgi:hypothetical protein
MNNVFMEVPRSFPGPTLQKNNFIRRRAEELGVLNCLKVRLLFVQRWTSKLFFKVCTEQILKFLGSSQSRKSAKFLGVPIRKIANAQIVMIYLIIANMKIPTKYCTTLPQNRPKI